MTASTHEVTETLARRFFQAISEHELDELALLLAADFRLVYGDREYDADAFLENERTYIAAFPDITHTVERLIAGTDFATVHCTVTGTHEGSDGTGVLGESAPTGNTFEISSLNTLQMDDGVITEVWTEWNALGMYDQLGLVEVAAD